MNEEKEESKEGICHYHLCRKKTTVYKCPYCGDYYCEEHLEPKIPMPPPFRTTDEAKVMEWQKSGGHPCPQYVDQWEWEQEQKKEKHKRALENVLSMPMGKEKAIGEGNFVPFHTASKTSRKPRTSRRKTKKPKKHYKVKRWKPIAKKVITIIIILGIAGLPFYGIQSGKLKEIFGGIGDVFEEKKDVEIVSYKVVAQKDVGFLLWRPIKEGEEPDRWLIEGTAKNTAGKMLSSVGIAVKFYDANNTYLGESYYWSNIEHDIPSGYTWSFSVSYDGKYVKDVDHFSFIAIVNDEEQELGLGNKPPIVTISANPTSGYRPLLVSFNANATDPDGSIQSYHWDFDDGTASNLSNPSHIFDPSDYKLNLQHGLWTHKVVYTVIVTVTDDEGTSTSKSVIITAKADPLVASISASPTSGEAPLTVHFTGSAKGKGRTTIYYEWILWDSQESMSYLKNPTYTFNKRGLYTVYLTVTDEYGGRASDFIRIHVS